MDRRGTGTFLENIKESLISNLGTKVISIIIATVLWGVVLGSRNVEVTKEIPLEVITPSDIVPANEIPDRIAFRLSGPKAFLRSILDRREDPIRVNLSGAKPALVTYRFFSDNIRVPIGVKVLSINPTAILIKLEYLKRKEVPVHVELSGTPPEGFRIVKAEVRPERIRIKGAESRVDSMTEIPTTPIDISNLKKSLEKEVPVDLSRYNVQLEGELPRAFIEVEPILPKFRIKNVDIRVISSYKAEVEEKTVMVEVRASPKDIRNLDRSQIYAVLDLRGKTKGKYSEPVKVVLPKNITLVRVVPSLVNVTVY
jgi:YbbR domain-containing protein